MTNSISERLFARLIHEEIRFLQDLYVRACLTGPDTVHNIRAKLTFRQTELEELLREK